MKFLSCPGSATTNLASQGGTGVLHPVSRGLVRDHALIQRMKQKPGRRYRRRAHELIVAKSLLSLINAVKRKSTCYPTFFPYTERYVACATSPLAKCHSYSISGLVK